MAGAGEGAGSVAATAEAEVGQLDTVLLRLALIDTDEKLQTVLHGSLPLILNMLSSPHGATKKKVLEVLGHINKRTAGVGIRLPLTALVAQYLDASVGAFQKNFTLIYVKQAFPQASVEEQTAAAHTLLTGIASRPVVHRAVLFSVAVSALPSMQLPMLMTDPDQKDIDRLQGEFPWLFVEADREVVLGRMLITLLSNFACYSNRYVALLAMS